MDAMDLQSLVPTAAFIRNVCKKYAFLFLSSQQIQYSLIMHLASYYFV